MQKYKTIDFSFGSPQRIGEFLNFLSNFNDRVDYMTGYENLEYHIFVHPTNSANDLDVEVINQAYKKIISEQNANLKKI